MTSCYATVLFIQDGLFISIDQAGNYDFANLVAYQWLIEKLIYLAYSIWPDIPFIIGLLS